MDKRCKIGLQKHPGLGMLLSDWIWEWHVMPAIFLLSCQPTNQHMIKTIRTTKDQRCLLTDELWPISKMISHYTKYKFNTNLLPNHNKTIICQQYLFSMWLPPWLFGHITHGFEVTIAKWSVAASGLIAKRLGFKMGNCFAGKISRILR